jgi:hypothetical protein
MILSRISWRATFFYSAGMGLLTVIGALVFFEDDSQTPKDNASRTSLVLQIDWLGTLLITSGIILFLFGLTSGRSTEQGWKSPSVIASLAVGIFFVLAFIFWQRYLEIVNNSNHEFTSRHLSKWAPIPMAPPSLWTRGNGRMAAMFGIAFFHWAAFSSWQFWIQVHTSTIFDPHWISNSLSVVLSRICGTFAGPNDAQALAYECDRPSL